MFNPREAGADCDHCPLAGQRVVPPESASGKLRLVLVGEGPGRIEEKMGKPFVGPSGQLLFQTLKSAEIARPDCHVTNAILCRNESDKELEKASECCRGRLLRELKDLDTAAPILTLGKTATNAVLGNKRLMKMRGFKWETPKIDEKKVKAAVRKAVKTGDAGDAQRALVLGLRSELAGRVVFPSLHPAFILRADNFKPVFEIDVKRVGRWLKGNWASDTLGPWETTTDIGRLYELGSEVAFDIETTSINPMTTDMLCIGFSDGEKAFVIHPWKREMAEGVSSFLRSRKACVGHNVYAFDMIVMKRHGIVFDGVTVEDTILAMHSFASHLPKGLDFLVSLFCDSWQWKMILKGGSDGKE